MGISLGSGGPSKAQSPSEAESPSDAEPRLLDAEGRMVSDLWLDQPDTQARLEARYAEGSLSAADAIRLGHFAEHGFLTTHIDLDAAATATLDDEIGRLWQERPANLAVAVPGPDIPTSFEDFDGPERQVGYRIPDLHGSSQSALGLYLHPEIFRLVDLIFGEESIAFQSLYFEYGSAQAVHRDPMFVQTRPVPHLVAAWIALEDITPDSGPLIYLPGSHRFPWFEFSENSVAMKPGARAGESEYTEWNREFLLREPRAWKRLLAKRGDVFLWHAGLMHGGSKIQNREQTRKSFVVHYSTAANYHRRTAYMRVLDRGRMRTYSASTSAIVLAPGARGLDSPMKPRQSPANAPARQKPPPSLPRRAVRKARRIVKSPFRR
jgi:ectoine hydroxylase-related dioxygenase (phytanoyl-CoA dioxygenase family)